VFASEQEAVGFVARHAESINHAGVRLQWTDSGEARSVTTPLGSYWLVRMTDDRQDAPPG
jgi:hypothetical protein